MEHSTTKTEVLCADSAHNCCYSEGAKYISRKYCTAPKTALQHPDGTVDLVHEKTAKMVEQKAKEDLAAATAASAKEANGSTKDARSTVSVVNKPNGVDVVDEDDWVMECEGMVVPKILEIKGGLQ